MGIQGEIDESDYPLQVELLAGWLPLARPTQQGFRRR